MANKIAIISQNALKKVFPLGRFPKANLHEKTIIERYANAGYFIGLGATPTRAVLDFSGYPKTWAAKYFAMGYISDDPTVHWGSVNSGTIRWSEIDVSPDNKLMPAAAKAGLKFGATCSFVDNDVRSIGSFARRDREFTDGEIEILMDVVIRLHMAHMPQTKFSEYEASILGRLLKGYTISDIATEDEVSPTTIRKRINEARDALKARSDFEATTFAYNLGLLNEYK